MCLVTALWYIPPVVPRTFPYAVWWPDHPTSGEVVFAADADEAARVFVARHLAVWDACGYARKLSGAYTLKVATLTGVGTLPDVEVAWTAAIPAGFTRPRYLRVGP